MATEAQTFLREHWNKLRFDTVGHSWADPINDISSVDVYSVKQFYPNGKPKFGHLDRAPQFLNLKSLSDVPSVDRWRARVAWRHYYGLTKGGIYFQKHTYSDLDLDINLTFDFSVWGNHTGGWDRPGEGQLVCGEVTHTPKGERFKKWFACDEAFKLLVSVIRDGTNLTEDELGRRLLTDGHPDIYWAIARLVIFGNVQAFVDDCRYRNEHPNGTVSHKAVPAWAKHPAAGMVYGEYGYRCHDAGMRLPKPPPDFLHLVSFRLQQPQWWAEFQRLAAEQDVAYSHPAPGARCEACEYEKHQAFVNW